MARADWIGPEHGADRLARGIATFSKAIRMLLAQNQLTHEQMVKLSQWANPWGMTWLSTSQVSYLRTGQTKKIGPHTVDALAQINLRLAEAGGVTVPRDEEDPLHDFGPAPEGLIPDEPFWLKHPRTGDPLNAGDLFMVWIGRLTPQGLDDGHISDMEARRLSANIGRIVQAWARDNKMTIGKAMNEAVRFYGDHGERRQQRLRAVIVGFEVFSGEDLTEELPALGEMLGRLDGDGAIDANHVRERLYRLPRED